MSLVTHATELSFFPSYSKAFHRTLSKQGFKFKLSTKVIGTEQLADGRVGVKVEAAKGGNAETVSCLLRFVVSCCSMALCAVFIDQQSFCCKLVGG